MTRFFTPLKYENRDGIIRLEEDFEFHAGENQEDIICVPAGFECDGQSYPRLLWMIDNPHGLGAKAGVVHDYLYWLNGRPEPKSGRSYTREQADNIYLQALVETGLGGWRAKIRYWALRIFGSFAWASHAKRIRKEKLVRPLKRP